MSADRFAIDALTHTDGFPLQNGGIDAAALLKRLNRSTPSQPRVAQLNWGDYEKLLMAQ